MSALNKAAASGSGKMKIKKGDQVIVLSGKDKGKTGTVTQAMPRDGKVIVGGVNVATRHTKPSQGDPQGWPAEVRSAAARLQGRARCGRQADARSLRNAGWQEGPRGREDGSQDRWLTISPA